MRQDRKMVFNIPLPLFEYGNFKHHENLDVILDNLSNSHSSQLNGEF